MSDSTNPLSLVGNSHSQPNSMAVLYPNHSSRDSKHDSLSFNGFCYRFSRSLSGGRYGTEYRCCDDRCSARVLFNTPDDIAVRGNHLSCQFDHRSELRRRERIKQALLVLATSCSDPPSTIVRRVDETMKLDLKEKKSLAQFVSQRQRWLFGIDDAPIEEVEIPDVLRRTIRQRSVEHPDDTFLIFDSKAESSAGCRILIFASADMREKAARATVLFADGTYRVVTSGFATLYTIHTVVDCVSFPVFFCLIGNEKEETFIKTFEKVKPFLSSFNSECTVHTDCQIGAIRAFQRVFHCNVRLCLFHINQALWRTISQTGLAKDYNDVKKPMLHAFLRFLMSIPFLPLSKIKPTFVFVFRRQARCETIGVEPECRERFFEVVDYYDRFWLTRIGPELLCQFDAGERTNNHSEAFHRGLSQTVQVAHPRLPVLINLLQKVDAEMTLRFDKMRIGEYVATRSKKQIAFERGMMAAFDSYRRGTSKRSLASDDHTHEVRLLGDVSRLYIEHYHHIQQSRRRETVNLVGRSKQLVDEVLSAIEKQNSYIYGETGHDDDTEAGGSDFVDIDAVSEIVFDNLDIAQQFESHITAEQVLVVAESVPTGSGSFPSERTSSVGCVCENEEGGACKRRRRQRRKTLLQKMARFKAAL